jgi:hypothetical protein
MPEGCDLHEQSTGSPRRLSASSFRLCRHRVPTRPSLILSQLRDSVPLTHCESMFRGADLRRDGRWAEALPGRGLETPSGTPQKGGSGTPQKGGCRDTKQCKFWRVSSVLIQGMFCFWGVRGGFGGSRRGSFLGSFLGSQRPGKWTHKPPIPGPAPAPIRPEQKVRTAMDVRTYLRCVDKSTGCCEVVMVGSDMTLGE